MKWLLKWLLIVIVLISPLRRLLFFGGAEGDWYGHIEFEDFTEVNQKTRREKGPLVKIQIAPGQFVKMYRADAVAAGHLPGEKVSPAEEKTRPPSGDKLRKPEGEKGVTRETGVSVETVSLPSPPAHLPERRGGQGEGLMGIPGVGRATVRLLAARGVVTGEQLRAAVQGGGIRDMGLSGAALAAIEGWVSGGVG